MVVSVKFKRLEELQVNWENATTNKEQNDLLKSVVKRIWYNREDDEVTLEVEYL